MQNSNIFKTVKKIHFIGIGGIGISAIARMALLDKKTVSGSDTGVSLVANELKKLGAKISKGHYAKNLPNDTELVIYTTAISLENPEFLKANQLKIPTLTYPQALGLVSKEKYTIAVSGTHGKTTTTAMIGKILMDTKNDPSMIVGSLLKDSRSNLIVGKSKYFVCEACEYRRSFLNLTPKILVITNIDTDHLDYFKNLKDIQKAFAELAAKLSKDGFLVCDTSDKRLRPVIKKTKGGVINYSAIKADFKLKIPGQHNIADAKAAMAVADILKIPRAQTIKSLENFNGTWRRFEYKGVTKNGVVIYDDYAHHPTEIKTTLKGAREFFGNKKIWCVFQPHLYSRTKILLDDFAESFHNTDHVIITDIYAAREKDDGTINAKILTEAINKKSNNALCLGDFKKIEIFLKKNTHSGDIIITMGAGEAYQIGENLLKK